MIDTTTNTPIEVQGGTLQAWFTLPVSQIPAAKQLLEENGIPHLVDSWIVTSGGRPPWSTIHLDRTRDARRVQELLDSVP